MKIIFLDIDGVLCSARSKAAYGGYPLSTDPTTWGRFDRCAIDLLRRAVAVTGAHIVLSSSWRKSVNVPALEFALGVSIFGMTREAEMDEPRGSQIADWLSSNPAVAHYAILDDDEDFTEDQLHRLCKTSKHNGFMLAQFNKLLELLT